MKGFKVLIVDDSKLTVNFERDALSRADCDIRVASTGKEALDLVSTFRPDMVILDLYMPVMSGDECCRAIKSDPSSKHITVVMTTSVDREEDRERCLAAGCDDFLAKPFSEVDLLKAAERSSNIIVREFVRLPMFLDVYFGVEGKVYKGYMHDLSEGGALIDSEAIPHDATTLDLSFKLPGQTQTFEIEAEVVRVVDKKLELNRDVAVGFGVRFIKLPEDAKSAINSYVEKKMLENLDLKT